MKKFLALSPVNTLMKASLITSILILLCFVNNSCKKDAEIITEAAPNISTPSDISKITDWLDKVGLTFDSLGKLNIAKMKANIDSSAIKEVPFNKDRELIIIPLKDAYQTKNVTSAKTLKNLVLTKDLNHQIIGGEIVEIIPDESNAKVDIYKVIPKIFKREAVEISGIVSFSSMANKIFSEYEYKNGIISSIKYLQSKLKIDQEKTTRTNEVTCIDWYLLTYINGQLVSEQYLYTTCSGDCQTTRTINQDIRVSERGAKVMQIQCGGGGGDGGQTPKPSVLSITNNLANPCLKSTFDLIMINEFTNDISTLLHNTFGASNKFHLTLNESTTLPPEKNANTNVVLNPDQSLNITISLNVNELPTATKEYTASTIYHEVLHAYLSTIGMKSQLDQHNEMANNYVSCMISSLRRTFHTLSYGPANALAWKGLASTTAWAGLNQGTRNEVIIEQNRQHAGLHGTTCN